jgi:shikimate dehydrogenase
MHTAAIRWLDLNAAYRAIPVPPEEWPDFLRQALDLPLAGFNVTVPYKEKILVNGPYKDVFVELTGAANTVVIRDRAMHSLWNTDGAGFWQDLQTNGVRVRDQKVAVLGAGGAARAVLGALYTQGAGPSQVVLINRTVERAQALAREFSQRMARCPEEGPRLQESLGRTPKPFPLVAAEDKAAAQEALQRAHLLVNTTSAGLRSGDAPPVPYAWLHRGLTVYDLIYHRETELLRAAKRMGARSVGGLGMLVHQGAKAFEIWFDLKPPIDVMMRAAKQELERRTSP